MKTSTMFAALRPRALPLALCLASLSATGAAFAQQQAMTEAQVRTTLEAGGYTSINDIEFDDGVWQADARSADGNRVELSLDPATGTIYPDEQVARLSEADVRAALATQGYTNVHDVDYDNGVWNAEADGAAGKDLNLRIDPATGKVIGQDKD